MVATQLQQYAMPVVNSVWFLIMLIFLVLLVLAYLCFLMYSMVTQQGTLSFQDALSKAKETKNLNHMILQFRQMLKKRGVL